MGVTMRAEGLKVSCTSGAAVEVTLVEPRKTYQTCFFSNLVLAGLRPFESLNHGYEALAKRYGISVVHESATAIDPAAKTVMLGNGKELPYDRLVAAPGIAFKDHALQGYDEAAMEIMPHAWNAGDDHGAGSRRPHQGRASRRRSEPA